MYVDDTAISDFDYDEKHAKLLVRFSSGEEYIYVGVPPIVHRAFADAPSKASFFGQRIRDCYPYNRLPV